MEELRVIMTVMPFGGKAQLDECRNLARRRYQTALIIYSELYHSQHNLRFEISTD